ncbi:MAG: hypothetical protein IKR92_03050 [Alphaproteobacteria bacterium]|nr:hypothetical protein [Alphaproteobacteria bacterium]
MEVKIPIYSIKYNFAPNSTVYSRAIGFIKNRAVPLSDSKTRKNFTDDATHDDYQPQYITTLYHKILQPRISLLNGKGRLPLEEACRRVRNLTIVAHCHGGYVVSELEKKMRADMKRLGYNLGERKQILAQLLTVAHAPACALGVAKSQMISFMTVEDIEWPKSVTQRVNNNFLNNYLCERKRENKFHQQCLMNGDEQGAAKHRAFNLPPCYFAPQQGNMFLIQEKSIKKNRDLFMVNNAEHNDIAYGYGGKSEDGILMTMIAKNIIQNGIKNSLRQKDGFTPLPKLEDLILGETPEYNAQLKTLFARMVENGKKLRNIVCQYAVDKLKKER